MSGCHGCDSCCAHRLCVQKVPIFASLSSEALLELSSRIGHLVFRKGDTLFTEGENPGKLFILNEGSVKALTTTSEGREQILYIFSEGDFFGEQFLLGNRRSTYSIEALEATKICTLSKVDLRTVLGNYPEIAMRIIEELEERLYGIEEVVQGLGVRSVDARIASLLLSFADKFGSEVAEGVSIRLPLSREGMANYLGVARETVSRKLGQLEIDGTLRSSGTRGLLILNREALEQAAGRVE